MNQAELEKSVRAPEHYYATGMNACGTPAGSVMPDGQTPFAMGASGQPDSAMDKRSDPIKESTTDQY